MKKLTKAILAMKIWRDKQGQDLIEYALMAGFVAVAVVTMSPEIAATFADIMSKANSVLVGAASS